MNKLQFCRSMLVMVSSLMVTGANINSAMAALYDDFQGDMVDLSKWTIQTDAGVSVTQTGGRLELSISPSASGDTFGGSVESKYLFSGDFDLQVDFSLVSWPLENGVRSGLRIYGLTSDSVVIERSASSPLGVFPESYVMDNSEIRGSTPTSDVIGKLRLKRVGNLITGYALDEVLGWQTIASYTNEEIGIVNSDPLMFSLSVWSHDIPPFFNPGGETVTVAFDNVMLTSVPIPPAVWLFSSGLIGLIGIARRKKS